MKKIILSGIEATNAIKRGVNKVADVVGRTLGPDGRDAIWGIGDRTEYENSNDGYRLIKQIQLDDEIENLATKALRDACTSTNDKLGDGTTSTVVLAKAVYNAGYEKTFFENSLVKSGNPVSTKKEILESAKKVFEELKKHIQEVKDEKDIWKVAFVSSNSKELSDLVVEAYKKVGKDAAILVEEGLDLVSSVEVVEGLEVPHGLIHPALTTDVRGNEAVVDSSKEPVYVLFTNELIATGDQLMPIVGELSSRGVKKLVLFARAFNYTIYPTLIQNKLRGIFHIVAVTFPTSDDVMEDYAIATGGTFLSQDKGLPMTEAKFEHLGQADKVVVYRNDLQNRAFIVKGKANKATLEDRIVKLKNELKVEKVLGLKDKLRKRIGVLSGGIGIIKVGAASEGDKLYIKRKLEDTIGSCRSAIQAGVVQGGGMTLKKIAETLPENILTEALKAPYQKIQENSGGLKVSKDILDPAEVVELSLKNAIEVACRLLCTEVAIETEKEKPCSCNSIDSQVKMAENIQAAVDIAKNGN